MSKSLAREGFKPEHQSNSQIIFFEGCDPKKGSTILLSGPLSPSQGPQYSHFEEYTLHKIKDQLKRMLIISRNIILEREWLFHLRVNPPLPLSFFQNMDKQQDYRKIYELEGFSPFLVTRNIRNRSTLVMYKVMIELRQSVKEGGRQRYFNETFQNDSIDMKSINGRERKRGR